MAALQKIRSKAGLLIGVLAVALLAFIFPWNEFSNFIQRQRDKAFVVDGNVVTTGAYQKRITEFENLQKMMSGQSSLNEAAISQIREFVYEQMVKEMMLDEQAKQLGLGVSIEELQDMTKVGPSLSPILGQLPLFTDPQTRQFSPEAYNQFIEVVNTDMNTIPTEQVDQRMQLENLKSMWSSILNMIKYQRLEEKYNALLSSAIMVNDIEIKANNEASKSTSDIAYVIERYSSIPDSTIAVSSKEIENLYKTRKNNFRNNDNLRSISYFTKEIRPSQSDFDEVEKEITAVREKLLTTDNPAMIVADYSEVPYHDIFFSEKNLSPEEANFAKTASVGDVDGPIASGDVFNLYKLVDKTMASDSVQLRMIVVPEGTDRLAASNRADSIMNVIKQGKDFATVANEIFPQSNGGEIGWVTEPQLASAGKEFIDAGFKTPVGDIVKINQNGQFQIIKVEGKTKPVPKYKIALVQMTVGVSEQTMAAIENEINSFVAQNSDGKNFEKDAQEKGYNLSRNVTISGAQTSLQQINGSRQVIYWAFDDEVGAVKKFDLSDYKIVAKINSKTKAGYLPVSEVAASLKAELIKNKKAEKMIADLKAKNITSLEGYAEAVSGRIDTVKFVTFNTPNIMGLGRESILNVYAEIGQTNKLEGPLKGDNGVIMLNVLNKTDQSTDTNPETYKQTMNSQNMYRIMSQLVPALKEKMKVEDNRIAFPFF